MRPVDALDISRLNLNHEMGANMKKIVTLLFATAALAACARTETIRTSNNTMLLQTSAAPACGATGAARVASKMAAVETLRAGFDKYIIMAGGSQNNVSLVQTPGTVYTTGNLTYGGGYGTYSGRSTYIPGATIPVGTHDQSLQVVMFKANDPQARNAISARETLGTEWQDAVKNGINTCT
jgi:hypothetical protein